MRKFLLFIILLNYFIVFSYANDTYLNPETGFKITAPVEWKEIKLPSPSIGGVKIGWSKTGTNDNPMMFVNIGPAPSLPQDGSSKTLSEEFARQVMRSYIQAQVSTQPGLKIIQSPTEVALNEIKWFKIVTESVVYGSDGKTFTLRAEDYLTVIGDKGIMIRIMDDKDHFSAIAKEVSNSLNTATIGR